MSQNCERNFDFLKCPSDNEARIETKLRFQINKVPSLQLALKPNNTQRANLVGLV